MTYSYIHRMINHDMFPNALELFQSELMTGRGRGKYTYQVEVRQHAEKFFREKLRYYFPQNPILYIV